jgi:hypothetical protein
MTGAHRVPSDEFIHLIVEAGSERSYRRTGKRLNRDLTGAEAMDEIDWGAPLMLAAMCGINAGYQWALLGRLAAVYARHFTVAGLAFLLWEIMQASPQDPRHPWTYRHAADISARAHRFTDRSDAQDRAVWEAFTRGRTPDGRRLARRPGARVPGRRAS